MVFPLFVVGRIIPVGLLSAVMVFPLFVVGRIIPVGRETVARSLKPAKVPLAFR